LSASVSSARLSARSLTLPTTTDDAHGPAPDSGWLIRLQHPVPDIEDFKQLDASLRAALSGALAAAGLDGAPPPGAAELMQPGVFTALHAPLADALEKVRWTGLGSVGLVSDSFGRLGSWGLAYLQGAAEATAAGFAAASLPSCQQHPPHPTQPPRRSIPNNPIQK